MNDDVRARFLAAIARQIPGEHVTEVHLFPSIRQGGIESGVAVVAVERAPAPRCTVYSARYRHTLKGIDRGKWEVSVMEEADAPLLTVDAVVRGVSRRSGDADETVRLSGDEFRASVPAPTGA
jgi:hypothetical protein